MSGLSSRGLLDVYLDDEYWIAGYERFAVVVAVVEGRGAVDSVLEDGVGWDLAVEVREAVGFVLEEELM